MVGMKFGCVNIGPQLDESLKAHGGGKWSVSREILRDPESTVSSLKKKKLLIYVSLRWIFWLLHKSFLWLQRVGIHRLQHLGSPFFGSFPCCRIGTTCLGFSSWGSRAPGQRLGSCAHRPAALCLWNLPQSRDWTRVPWLPRLVYVRPSVNICRAQ